MTPHLGAYRRAAALCVSSVPSQASHVTFRFGLHAAVFLAALLVGCDAISHRPTGENVVDVDPTVDPVLVDLGAAPDTIVVWGEVAVRPAVSDDETRGVASSELYIDDERVAESRGATPLRFDSRSVADGPHPLRVVVRTARSGTGSLADRQGYEHASGQTSRVLVVDNAPLKPVQTTLDSKGRRLTVRWERSDRPAFQAYALYRVDEYGNRTLVEQITDRNVTLRTDSTFVVGHVGYAVDLEAADRTARGPSAEATFPLAFESVVSEESESLGTARLAWPRAPFPDALGAYVVVRRTSGNSIEIARRTDPGDTTVVDHVRHPLGATYEYDLWVEDRDGQTTVAATSRTVLFDPRAPFSPFATTAGGLFARTDAAVVRLDPRTLAETARYDGYAPYVAVGGAQVAVVTAPSALSPTPRVRLLDARTLSLTDQKDAADVFGDDLSPTLSSNTPGAVPNKVVLTPDGHLLTDVATGSPSRTVSAGVAAVDLAAGAVTGRLSNSWADLRAGSPDGRYAVVTGGSGVGSGPVLYEIDDGGRFRPLGALPAAEYAFVAGDRLAALEDGVLRVLAVPSLAEVQRVPVPAPSATGLAFDSGSGLLLTVAPHPDGRLLRGYDPLSGAAVFSEVASDLAALHGGLLWVGARYRRVAPLR